MESDPVSDILTPILFSIIQNVTDLMNQFFFHNTEYLHDTPHYSRNLQKVMESNGDIKMLRAYGQ